MPAAALRPPARRAPAPRFHAVVPLAVARQVIEEAARWLDAPLPDAWAVALARRAEVAARHTPGWRQKLARPGDEGREHLYAFLRHWLADRLLAEQPALFARLPSGYALGHPLPAADPAARRASAVRRSDRDDGLSPDARLLLAI